MNCFERQELRWRDNVEKAGTETENPPTEIMHSAKKYIMEVFKICCCGMLAVQVDEQSLITCGRDGKVLR